MFDPFVCNGLLMAHVKAVKDLVSTRQVFDEMPHRNLVCCWTSLISGYARLGLAEKALKLFMVMLKENLQPESDTMVTAEDMEAYRMKRWKHTG
ncbi:pentatricopeptide repeat-containing protein At5g61800-like isoform X1 [Sesamum indicum]|uniref:Pentatricopeptide repeat-containing protein At5g61800-like isoform X1 n=1 Tax=Sesamum indicum TaxID=4182 RepID=A0A6I9UHT9_SESIN|nr:pentatricopeptide repeat-containing protein At5g61800-like isoform X1 [Sesamum indicum]